MRGFKPSPKSPSKKRDFSRSYDVVGNIAVIDSKPTFAKKIAREIMKTNKNVKTVLRKGGAVSGTYRTRKHIYVTGKRSYVAEYRENGCIFHVDLRKCFFSTRLAYERNRIADLVKNKENVLVMFSGVGPFAIEIGKRVKSANVVGVELNNDAYKYMKENIKLNKVGNVLAVHGDVKSYTKKHKNFADRIVMPLPMTAYKFLGSVYSASKNKCTVHYYSFGDASSAFVDNIVALENFFSRRNASIKIIGKRTVRPYSSRMVEVGIDFVLYKK